MVTLRRLMFVLMLLLLPMRAPAQLTVVGDGGTGPYKAQHLTVELTSLAPSVAPGGHVTLGLVITLEQHWHVYWINAGDSGEPPSVKWTLPPNVSVGPMEFPTPSRLPLGPLMDYGYEDTAAFPFEMKVAPKAKQGPVHLDAKVSWLVCREVCIPGKAHLGLTLNVAPNAPEGQEVGALGAAVKSLPEPLPPDQQFTVHGGKQEFVLTLTNAPDVDGDDVEFYPLDQDQVLNSGEQTFEAIPNGFRLRVPRAPDPSLPNDGTGPAPPPGKLPAALHGLLKLSDGESYEVSAPVVPGEMPQTPQPAKPLAAGVSHPPGLTVLPAIGLALLGGIILNLMPCVFPVLFLKGLALVQSSGEERKRMRLHGLVYTLGILVSFWLIVGALLVLRAAGSNIGWGFQLQSPTFIAILASFLFFFALSLAGQFDLGLSLTSAGGGLAKKEGFAGSFFTGVLATVVATPCTAPLMGAAIGFALAQPPVFTFAIFSALGLGLALPYLLLTLEPSWTRVLPRPGAWMETLKHLTSVPLFATVIWLVWVYGRLHTGPSGTESDHVGYLLLCFLLLAIAGWVLHRWPARWGASLAAALLVLLGIAIPLATTRSVSPSPGAVEAAASATGEPNLAWQPYTAEALSSARAAGRPVFVDFTAAWCLSCQVNERAVLRAADVEHQFAAHKFVLLRADWTKYSPEITAELASLNRSGVPTYVIYPAVGRTQPDVLPELLTKGAVLTAIKQDVR